MLPTYSVGDTLQVMITGMTGKYMVAVFSIGGDGIRATPEHPHLVVKREDGWNSVLKPGDYVILRERPPKGGEGVAPC